MTKTSATKDETCRFCSATPHRCILIEGKNGFVALDRHPVSDGHFLVIPYRHFSNFFEINNEELNELWLLASQGKEMIDEKYHPDGYNIGINIGKWAGQSIPHLHIHVIPRYKGDVENPKGGIRGIIPERKLYTILPD